MCTGLNYTLVLFKLSVNFPSAVLLVASGWLSRKRNNALEECKRKLSAIKYHCLRRCSVITSMFGDGWFDSAIYICLVVAEAGYLVYWVKFPWWQVPWFEGGNRNWRMTVGTGVSTRVLVKVLDSLWHLSDVRVPATSRRRVCLVALRALLL